MNITIKKIDIVENTKNDSLQENFKITEFQKKKKQVYSIQKHHLNIVYDGSKTII